MEFAKRRIGRTTLEVTVLGLGCATLGGRRVPVTREEAEAIARRAWEAGIRYIDAAPYYGFGQAERAVGDALRLMPREEWVLSTKVGRLLKPRRTPDPGGHPMPFEASTIIPMTASCARSRIAFSASASPASTYSMCTTSVPCSTVRRRIPL
jgi:aryl-alcohol dehydrogenase-like predicted oxidoreductase